MWFPQTILQNDDKVIDLSDANYKRVMLAILLSACPGLGQVYAGKLYRGIIGYLGLILLSWLSAILFLAIEYRLLSIIILCLPFIYTLAVCVDAAFCAIRKSTRKTHLLLLHIVLFIAIFTCLNTLVDNLVGKHIVRAFFVTTPSMSPNILKYDLLLIDKISTPDKGDVALLEFSHNTDDDSISSIIQDQTLRRIIAVEGDLVEIRGSQVYINKEPITEKYAYNGYSSSHNIYTIKNYSWGPEIVPKDSFFVLSDSRQYGFDSRTYGFIHRDHIHGIAAKVLWSWNVDEGYLKWKRTALSIK